MELVLSDGFFEMSQNELYELDAGDTGDFFEKISPLHALEFVYQVGQDFGAASVKFGRECYDFYRDVKKILK